MNKRPMNTFHTSPQKVKKFSQTFGHHKILEHIFSRKSLVTLLIFKYQLNLSVFLTSSILVTGLLSISFLPTNTSLVYFSWLKVFFKVLRIHKFITAFFLCAGYNFENKRHKQTHKVLLSSASGSSVASFRFSKLIFSLGLWFHANNTAS